MSLFKKWSRRQQRDKGALQRLHESEPPTGAADFPLIVNFGWGGRAGQLLGVVLAVAGPLLLYLILAFAIVFELGLFLLALASMLPDFTNLNTAVIVSGEGVRLEKLHRSYTNPLVGCAIHPGNPRSVFDKGHRSRCARYSRNRQSEPGKAGRTPPGHPCPARG